MISHANCYFLIANYFILVRYSACKSWKKISLAINQNTFYPEILHSRILFLLIQLESKVLEIKSKIKRHYL